MTVKKQTPKKKKLSVVEDLKETLDLYEFLLDEFVAENEQLMKTVQSKDRAYSEIVKKNERLADMVEEECKTNFRRKERIYNLEYDIENVKGDRSFFIFTTVIMVIAYFFMFI